MPEKIYDILELNKMNREDLFIIACKLCLSPAGLGKQSIIYLILEKQAEKLNNN